jgi:hypothetical protein
MCLDQVYLGHYRWTDMAYFGYPPLDSVVTALDYIYYFSPNGSPINAFNNAGLHAPPSEAPFALEYNYNLTASPADLMGMPTDTGLGLHISTPELSLVLPPSTYTACSLGPLSASSSMTSSDFSPSVPHSAAFDYFSLPSSPYGHVYTPMHCPASTRPAAEFVTFLSSLDEMIDGWTDAEIQAGRRLVHFTISRGMGEQRTVSCRPIHPSEYVSVDLVDTVSCIARPNGAGFVITSVDLLHLAGLLYAGRPDTEEKNRLRRHLERLDPKTIGKSRDSNGLYARIASFNEPRPLTIVKDVKVFEWMRLEEAMEAIVAKRVSDARDPFLL